MISQYDELKKKYKESVERYVLKDSSNLDGSKVNSIDASKPHDKSFLLQYLKNQNAEREFVTDLKTSRLKAVEQKRLTNSFESIRNMYTKSIAVLQKSVDDAQRTNEVNVEELGRLKNDMQEQMKSAAQNLELLNADKQRLKNELIDCKKELEMARKKKVEMVKKHKADMNLFLSKMDKEVEVVQLTMKEEAAKKIAEVKAALTRDNDSKLQHLHNDLLKIQTENTQCRDRFKEKEEGYQKELDDLKAMVASKSNELGKLQEKLQISEEKTKQSSVKLNDLQHSMDHQKKHWAETFEKQKDERQNELSIIEHKVTNIINFKDYKIKILQERSTKAEKRVEELEKLFQCIETGFVDEKKEECNN